MLGPMEAGGILVTAGEGGALRAAGRAGMLDLGAPDAPGSALETVVAARGIRRVQASRAVLVGQVPRGRGGGDGRRGAIRVRD